jgi:hypothetical protein
MCFFDQCVYLCGDFKWGPFRQHCAKEYRKGETCGMKLVMQNVHVHTRCRICDRLEAKYNRKAKEKDRIKRWKKEGGKRQAFIEASDNIIQGLNRDIAKLMRERRDRLNHRTEAYNSEGLALPVYSPRMEGYIPGIINLPTRHRLEDSSNKVILESSFPSTENLLAQEKTSLAESCIESGLMKVTSNEKITPANAAHQSDDDQSNLCESKTDQIEVPRGDFLLRFHTGMKFGGQETIVQDASMSGKIVSRIWNH